MNALYNEFEPYAVQWLHNLIAAGHVAPGVIDARSIADLKASDVVGGGQRHFFAGIGVWSAALRDVGVPDDADIWTASCPCQPFSAAGRRRGTADERHLWPVLRGLIAECRPSVVFGEQVASRDGRTWLAAVRADLEALGYAVGAADLCAAGVGAPHIRQRLYFVAYADDAGPQGWSECGDGADQRVARPSGVAGGMVDASGTRGGRDTRADDRTKGTSEGAGRGARRVGDKPCVTSADGFWSACDWIPCSDGKSRPVEPGTFPLAHGVAGRVGRLRAYGNAIVRQQAAAFVKAAFDALRDTNP